MKKRLSIILTGLTALLGIIVLFVVYFTQQGIIKTYGEKLPYISLGDNIKNKTTKGHLWFEEHMAGDESINFEKDVLTFFSNSKHILIDAIEGGENELGKFNRTDDAKATEIINKAVKELESLINFTNLREKNKLEKEKKVAQIASDSTKEAVASSGEEAGGEIDQQFDAAYERVQEALDELINHIHSEVDKNVARIKFEAVVTISALFILFSILCFYIYRIQRKNERAEKANKEQYEKEMERVEQMTNFVEGIAGGNLNTEITLNIEDDHLAKTLVDMRNNLKRVALEDERRNWANEGFAKFGEMLRTDNDDLEKLGSNILSGIIKYTKANQGALFIINDENENDLHLQLISCYAWGRKKFLQTRIEIGEGLVGQCWQEQEKIYLTDVPENFIKITSGVGEANPNCILIVPLKINEKIYGIIEMASFKQFENYQIEFVEKFAESMASAISSVKINDRTKKLLQVSQQQSEEMKAQEEEMRQSMEELTATQEEMGRKAAETENKVNAIDQSGIASIEFSMDGTIIDANVHFLNLMEYTLDEIEGKHHRIFVDKETAASKEYADFWKDLREGNARPGEYSRVTKSGKRVYIKGSYSIINDQHGAPYRVLKLANDITQLKKQQEEMTQMALETKNRINAIEESGIASIEFNLDGTVISANKHFLSLMEYSMDEIKGKHHRIFVDNTTSASKEYADFWKDLREGNARPGEYNRVTKTGKRVYIKGSYSIIRDEKGTPSRVLKLASDITQLKK